MHVLAMDLGFSYDPRISARDLRFRYADRDAVHVAGRRHKGILVVPDDMFRPCTEAEVRTATESVHLVAAAVGFASFALLWLSIVWGLVLANGWTMTRMRHRTVVAIHHTVALLGLTLGLVHGLAQMAVPGGPVRWVDQVVPFLNPTDPVGWAWASWPIELFRGRGPFGAGAAAAGPRPLARRAPAHLRARSCSWSVTS
jgi:hypothetical protein